MKRNGFTLLEILIVMMIVSLIIGVIFAIYNVMLDNFSASTTERLYQQELLNGLYALEDDIRTAEDAVALSPQQLVVINRAVTSSYFLKTDPPYYQLWVSKNSRTADISYPLCSRVVSGNTLFSVDKPWVAVTLNAISATSSVFLTPLSLTVSSKIYLRNTAYGQR